MNTATFDTFAAMRRLEKAGLPSNLAEAIVDTMRDSAGVLTTKADLADLRADIYRALWIQGLGIVTIIGVFIAIAAALKLL